MSQNKTLTEDKKIILLKNKLDLLDKEEQEFVKKKKIKEADRTLVLIESIKKSLYEYEISKLARESASYFIIGILVSFIIFILLWYMSIDDGNMNGYFNSLFCNLKK